MQKFFSVIFTLSILVTLAVGLVACGKQSSDPSSQNQAVTQEVVQQAGADEAKALLPKAFILDVRESYEYEQGHLQGSVLIPIGEITQRMSEIPKGQPILVVCATGARSASVSQYLVENGYIEVYNLVGGISAWPYGLGK